MPKVDGFFYIERGRDERGTVLFIHGAGGSHQNWVLQVRNVPEGYRFIAVDLPGHGKSEGPFYNSAEKYAEEILKFVEVLGVDGLKAMVGHSLGGCIGVWTYLKCLKVGSLVLVSSALKLWGAEKVSKPPDRYHICDSLFFDWKLRVQCKKGSVGLFNTDFEVLKADMEAASGCDLRKFANKINIPVLLVYGYYDRMLPSWAVEETFLLLRDRATKVGLESAHMPMIEKYEEFNITLKEFLR